MSKIIKINNLNSQYKELSSEIIKSINKVFKSSNFINGKEVTDFEKNLQKRYKVKNVITCANGTDAIQIAIMSLNLRKGSEVIMPSFSYISTIETVVMLGMKPILVDVDANTFNIDVLKINNHINKKTKLIIPVHLYGQNSNMEDIMKIANKNNLFVIEDAAQAIDSDIKFKNGKIYKSGTVGNIGCYSFFPNKNLGCYGDGGALVTNNSKLAKNIRMIKNHGQKKKYHHEVVGVNSRLDTIQAAILKIKLKNLKKENNLRNKNANFYSANLDSCKQILLPKKINYSNHVFHQYTIKVLNRKRDKLKDFLRVNGIESIVYYPKPLHFQKAYQNLIKNKKKLIVSEKLSEQVLSIPVHAYLTKKELKYIAHKIIEFYD